MLVVVLLFGAAPTDPGAADPHAAALRREAASQAAAADSTLAEAEEMMTEGTAEAGRGQAAVLAGEEDPATFMDGAAAAFEAAAAPVDAAQASLEALRWTLLALDPNAPPPTLGLSGADVAAIGVQWRATALPLSALSRPPPSGRGDPGGAERCPGRDRRRRSRGCARGRFRGGGFARLGARLRGRAVDPAGVGGHGRGAPGRDRGHCPGCAGGRRCGVGRGPGSVRSGRGERDDGGPRPHHRPGRGGSGDTGPASAASAVALRVVGATRAALASLSILP